MADEVFRPRRPGQEPQANAPQSGTDALNQANAVRAQLNQSETPQGEPAMDMGMAAGVNVSGPIPAAFQQALNAARAQSSGDLAPPAPKRGFGQMSAGGEAPTPAPVPQNFSAAGSGHLKALLDNLRGASTMYEEIELPSKGRFYDGQTGPANGVISIRPMTGEEEQILATPRFVRKGQAINMIFQKCMKEDYRAEQLLSVDRTYLLIYLRGISYSPNYDVEVKCPECDKKFSTTIDLNSLYVESCPDDYGPMLKDVLPSSKLPFTYRLGTGKDEQDIQDHRDRRIKAFGDASADDTLLYRTALLLGDIDGISNKTELQILLKNLPINDVSYIRNCINEPPFGVDTDIDIICPSCLEEFTLDLPLESNFFFPRRKKAKTQA